MLKKLGVVTVGVTAGLMAAAPFASAHESGHDSGHDSGHGKHHDSSDCNVTGGSAEANGGISGDSFLGNALVQAPIGGANAANIVCNDILNGNLSGNDVAVSVLGQEAAAPTPPVSASEAPEAPEADDTETPEADEPEADEPEGDEPEGDEPEGDETEGDETPEAPEIPGALAG